MSDYITNKMETMISSFTQLPYLFVGTGLSMRYANAPSWDTLLLDTWKTTNPDKTEREYEKFKQQTELEVQKEFPDLSVDEQKYHINPILASKIEQDFCHYYYTSPEFERTVFSENESSTIIENHFNPFKFFVSKKSGEITLDPSKPNYKELSSLMENQNKFAGIITTNYDTILEKIFNDFSVLVGQDSLLLSNNLSIFEIFKIHGCSSNPNSIVLTEEDYDNFDRKLKYLSAKLLTIFVEHPIIFLGYGLGDANIRKLLNEIAECLSSEQLEKIKNNFIFVSPAFGVKDDFTEKEIIFGKRSIIINEFKLNDYSMLYQTLSNIQSSLPIKLARKLQDMVCDFVYSSDAQNTIIFGDINSPDIDEEKAAIYFGKADFVTQMGFNYFKIDDILEDILFDNKPYLVNTQLIEKTFKNIRSSAGTTLLPVYKYIKALGYDLARIPSNYHIIRNYSDKDIQPTETEKRHYIKNLGTFNSIKEIEELFPGHIPKQSAYIKKFARNITTEDLGDYLKRNFHTENFEKNKSIFRKLIAIYDYKKYS